MKASFRQQCDVAVIGAGAAGIAAARELTAAKLDVQLIEARSRPGGRALTEIHGGHALDLGCGWLHSADDNPYVGIAGDLGFTADKTPPPWQEMMSEDAFPSQDQAAFRSAQAKFYSRLEAAAQEPTDRPASDCLDQGAPWSALIDAVSTYVNGCELARLSAKDFDNYHDSEINYRITQGYGALIARLADDVPAIYDCPVSRIDHSGAMISVETARGALQARAIVIAVPTNILAREIIRFTPAIPSKLEAAAMLPLGIANKLYLAVEGPEELPDNGRIFGQIDRNDTGAYHLRPFGKPLIEGYFGGDCARGLEKDGLAAFSAFAIEEICGMLGNLWRNRLRPLAASAWANDPFALGSYSHAMPGHWDKRAVLASPVNNRLFFCRRGDIAALFFDSTRRT